jgi:hypothetical protein
MTDENKIAVKKSDLEIHLKGTDFKVTREEAEELRDQLTHALGYNEVAVNTTLDNLNKQFDNMFEDMLDAVNFDSIPKIKLRSVR